MDAEIASHTFELLERISAKVDAMAFDVVDIKSRLTTLDEGQASLSFRVRSVAGFGKRMDRIEGRLERIERRLELRDGTED